MKEALVSLFSSKKAIAAMAGTLATVLVVIAGKQGWVIDGEAAKLLVAAILGLAGLYIGGQGVADWGKEAAKIKAAAEAVVSTAEKAPEPAGEPEKKVLTEEV